MSKFCTTCGAQLDDNATFCTSCGSPQTASQQNAQPQHGGFNASNAINGVKNTFNDIKDKVDVNAVKESLTVENIKGLTGSNPNKNTLIALAAIVVAVILVLIILSSILGGGYKKPLDYMFKGMAKGDGKTFAKCLPDVLLESDDFEDELDDEGYDSAAEYFDEYLEYYVDYLEDEYGENLKITYKVEDKDELSKKELKEIKSDLKDEGAKKVKVTKGYELDLEVTIKGKDDKDTDDMTVQVAKVNGQWCIVDGGII